MLLYLLMLMGSLYGASASTASLPPSAEKDVKSIVVVDQPFATNTLFIFLDDSETTFGAITQDCTQAVAQKASMILVSIHLLNNVIKHMPEEIGKAFDPQEWRLRKVGMHMVLMIPQPQSASKMPGLHLESMPEIEVKELAAEAGQKGITPADYFVADFSKMFITRAEYTAMKVKVEEMPQWAIYLDGHGKLGTISASLPHAQFQEVLRILEKIVTRLFVYATCYAIGTNSAAIYKDETGLLTGQTFSYIIATNGAVDTTSGAGFIKKGHGNKITWVLRFDLAEQQLKKPAPLNFDLLFKALFGRRPSTRFSFLRLPGMAWFNAHDAEKFSYSIGAIMAQHRTTPLDLSERFLDLDKDARPALLLYASRIPFEIIFGEMAPSLISMVPSGIHYFSSIKLKRHKITSFLRAIAKEPTSRKLTFLFKTISSNVWQPVFPPSPSHRGHRPLSPDFTQPFEQVFENVMVDIAPGGSHVLLTFKGKEYLMIDDVFADARYLKEYSERVEKTGSGKL